MIRFVRLREVFMNKLLILSAFAGVLVLAGCSTSAPMSLGQGKYTITSSNFFAWSGGGQQSDAIREANAFCGKQGKEARILSMEAHDAVAYQSVASGQVTFECVNPHMRDDIIPMAGDTYLIAGDAASYQGINARYQLMKKAAAFCAQKGGKVLPLSGTREVGMNESTRAGRGSTMNSGNSSLQSSSADLLFKCVRE